MSRTTDPAKIRLWQSRFKQFENSKLTIERFCASLDCCLATFYYWKRKLADPAATPIPDFVPVRISSAAAPVELVLPGGATLRLSPGCDLAFVRSLVEALAGGGPC